VTVFVFFDERISSLSDSGRSAVANPSDAEPKVELTLGDSYVLALAIE
jgi:hypothetical protein